MSGERVGARVSVHGNVLVGRDPDAQLVLADPGVSWQHAFVEDRGGTWVVADLGSTNGTLLNGSRSTESPLKHGDKLRFGSTIVRFEVQDETDEAYTQIISQLINIDDLTGLYLRRRFDSELETLISMAAGDETPLGLLAMDLDGIKAINDRHGHLFGAYTISEAGKLIGGIVGDIGIACRFGGDEYFAALPAHELDAAMAVAESIRVAIGEHHFEHEGVALKPGISIGVAAFPIHATDARTLFHVADEALYVAKRGGKNRVCASGSK
jgi:diguanylate cyclase (GGDEF)-like protein